MPQSFTPAPGSAINTAQDGAGPGSVYNVTTLQRITARPFPPGLVIQPATGRGSVTDATKVLDLLGNQASISADFLNLDFKLTQEAESPGIHTVGSQLLGVARGVYHNGCTWQGGGICYSAVNDASGRPSYMGWTDCRFRQAAEVLLQLTNCDRVTVQRCLFDDVGYGGNPGRLSMDRLHALYANNDVTVLKTIDNVVTRARGGGLRCGGERCSGNLVVDAGFSIVLHSGSRQCYANTLTLVHHPGLNPDGTYSYTGGGIKVSAGNGCLIQGNVLNHAGPATKGQQLYGIGLSDDKDGHGTTNCTLSGNTVYDWAAAGDDGIVRGCCLGIGATSGQGCTVTNEVYQQVRGGALIEVQGDPRRVAWGRNTYFSTDPKPFYANGRWMTFQEWQAASGDLNSVWKRTDLRLPTPSEACRSVLGSAGTDPGREIADAVMADWGKRRAVIDALRGVVTGTRA